MQKNPQRKCVDACISTLSLINDSQSGAEIGNSKSIRDLGIPKDKFGILGFHSV